MAEETSNTVADVDQANHSFVCGVVEGFYGRPWTPEQRRDLFRKMKKLGLNTYMYAPKDDFKHRAYWRELYTVEEAEHLTSLIQSAKENGIAFYYALSPGLDIGYSNSKELATLKRKLEQVSQFGCSAFALLFDDIEPEISETDKEVFQSFAQAQVSVANEIYQHLSQPTFLFCPTEYCAARAVPNVQNSEYLNTIGNKLLPGINIMWTGSKVISKNITVQSIQELSEVLKRPPVIWDNLHANDYDQKRLFLGPYCGRSTDLIPHLRGVLTNPNCEYETNFIPIHTLAQWSKCNADGKRDLSINDSVSADIKLEAESENGSVEDIPSHIGPNTYHPKHALKISITEWLPEFYRTKNAYGQVIPAPFVPAPIPACPPPMLNSVLSIAMAPPGTQPILPGAMPPNALAPDSSSFQPLSNELVNSLIAPRPVPEVKEDAILEPMDCNPSPSSSPKHNESRMDQPVTLDSETKDITNPEEQQNGGLESIDSAEEMQTEAVDNANTNDEDDRQLTADDISLLVDLFYLPFEHGSQGVQFLQEFFWLKTHGHTVSENRRKNKTEMQNPEVEEWYSRATKFDQMTQSVGKLLIRLTYCQNRSLLYDLYPYIWDIKGVISLLNSYVKWTALGRVPTGVNSFLSPPFTWFSKGYKEAFMSGEQEPWLFRGGLTAELQRLLPLESVSDLFLYKPPELPTSKIYTIRPYLASDEAAVYEVCRKTCDDGGDGSEVFPDYPNLIGDKLVGGFLCLSPEYCFVVEDESGVCGYALAALDAQQFQKKLEMAWITELCSKYPAPKKDNGEMMTPSEEIISSFHNYKCTMPEEVYKHHPSVVRMGILSTVSDLSVPKRLLACVLSTLKANGSHGLFSEVNVGDKTVLEFYSKLGFLEISLPSYTCEDTFYLGRTF